MINGAAVLRTAAVGAALALSACVPTKFTGYEPTGAGTAEPGYCVAGIRDTFRVDAPAGVRVNLRANLVSLRRESESVDRVVELDGWITVPKGVTVRLTAPTLRLESPAWPRPRDLEVHGISAGGPAFFGATDRLTGSRDAPEKFSLQVGLPGLGQLSQSGIAAPERFTLHLPPIEIDGRPFDVGPVTFQAYEKWGVFTCVQ